MELKRMSRPDWRCIAERRFVAEETFFEGWTGVAGLLMMDRVSEPVVVRSFGEPLTIADTGCSWLELAPRQAPVFVTAQFDARGQLFQIYFDVTSAAGNCFDDPLDPCFYDAYLDVIWDPRRGLKVLDRQELNAALAAGRLSPQEHEHAVTACGQLTQWLEEKASALSAFCAEERQKLLKGTGKR